MQVQYLRKYNLLSVNSYIQHVMEHGIFSTGTNISHISFFIISVLWKKVPVGVVYLTVLCDYPYLVSSLFAVLLTLHLAIFVMFFITCGI